MDLSSLFILVTGMKFPVGTDPPNMNPTNRAIPYTCRGSYTWAHIHVEALDPAAVNPSTNKIKYPQILKAFRLSKLNCTKGVFQNFHSSTPFENSTTNSSHFALIFQKKYTGKELETFILGFLAIPAIIIR